MPRPAYILALSLTAAFSLATVLQPEAGSWRTRSTEGGLMGMLLGDGRRMFANQFTVKADEYFHSGYYPSIFDQSPQSGNAPGHVHDENCHHDDEESAIQGNRTVEACEEHAGGWNVAHDWIARIGHNFRVTEHTHLEGKNRREVLPWLKISAELDPHQINTFLVGSYWLRKLGQSVEAEKFIREGLEANPQDCQLLHELAQIYLLDRKNPERARSLFELALSRWDAQEAAKEKPDLILLASIASNLARVEEAKGLIGAAIEHLERARQASPQSEALARQIEELKLQLKTSAPTNALPPR